MTTNFLNAQNYILWKTEKKKLLSKFFVENFLKKFYKVLSWFYFLISNIFITSIVWIFILMIFFIFYSFFWEIIKILIEKNIIFFFIFIILFIFFIKHYKKEQ
jgi:hypothetical protein